MKVGACAVDAGSGVSHAAQYGTDFHRVAGFCAIDMDRASYWIDLAKVELLQVGESGFCRKLAAGGVNRFELDGIARGDAQHWRVGIVPSMMAVS